MICVGSKLDPLIVSENERLNTPESMSRPKLSSRGEVSSRLNTATFCDVTSVRLLLFMSLTANELTDRLVLASVEARLERDLMMSKSLLKIEISIVSRGGLVANTAP